MKQKAQDVQGRVVTPPGQEAPPGLIAYANHFREHGLDLRSFSLAPTVIDISPRRYTVVKPTFDFRQLNINGTMAHYRFFPCCVQAQGKPFFGYVWIDMSDINQNKIKVLLTETHTLDEGIPVAISADPQRVVFS